MLSVLLGEIFSVVNIIFILVNLCLKLRKNLFLLKYKYIYKILKGKVFVRPYPVALKTSVV